MEITWIKVLSAIIAAIGALVASLIAARFSVNRRKEEEMRRMEIMKLYEERLSRRLGEYRKLYTLEDLNELWESLLEKSASASASSPISVRSMSKNDVQKEIDQRVESLKERIAGIENRFPQQSTIDKIASVNDAILATQVENLDKSINQLEEKLLTRWDVVKIVFQIIAALSGLIGVILAIITFLGSKAGA